MPRARYCGSCAMSATVSMRPTGTPALSSGGDHLLDGAAGRPRADGRRRSPPRASARPSLRARPGSSARSSRPMAFMRRLKMLSPLPATSTQASPAQR
jgi:hypothetical protein